MKGRGRKRVVLLKLCVFLGTVLVFAKTAGLRKGACASDRLEQGWTDGSRDAALAANLTMAGGTAGIPI